jgi:hypothetical protein
MSDIKVINDRKYKILTRNVCTGCSFFGGDDVGCKLPNDIEIECGPESVYVEVENDESELEKYRRAVEFHNELCEHHKRPEWLINMSKLDGVKSCECAGFTGRGCDTCGFTGKVGVNNEN